MLVMVALFKQSKPALDHLLLLLLLLLRLILGRLERIDVSVKGGASWRRLEQNMLLFISYCC